MGTLLAGSGLIAGRLFWLQILDSGRLVARAEEQRQRTWTVTPQRGSILASDGTELAMSLEMQTVYANPRNVADPGSAASALAPVLRMDAKRLQAKLSEDAGFVYLARKVDPAVADQVKALRIIGVQTVPESKRLYPAGSLASQVVGFVGDDNKGLAGLELRYEDVLAGRPGTIVMEKDPAGRPIASGESSVTEAVQGKDLLLTLDRQVQFQAEAALARAVKTWGAKGGSVVVLDPRNGNILAMASNPVFDPNNLAGSTAESRRNRPVMDVYEPGSVSKLVTASAALDTGVITPDAVLSVPDRMKIGPKTFSDSSPHPVLNLTFEQVIQRSSNIGTIKVAERLGKQSLYDYLGRFGYGRRTGVDLPGESAGIVPRPERWWSTSLGTIAIGQGVAVTPLQLARAYATVANGGMELRPNLVLATLDPSGRRRVMKPPAARRVITAQTASQMTQILVGVTKDGLGTGTAASIPGYLVAGKTGTAQKSQGAAGYSGYMSTFVGFAPADNPRLVVAVVLDDPTPYYAGQTAAVTFKEIMAFSLRRVGTGPASSPAIAGTALAAPAFPPPAGR